MPVAKPTGPGVKETKIRPWVLVVDDEPNLVEVVGDVVKSLDCRLVTAATVADARQVLATQDVELLVTDVNLPDGDGTALLSALHRRNPTASAIVMTGSPTVETATAALRQGAADFVPKPFTNDHLTARVRKALDLQARAAKDERKVERLRVAVKRLNEARKLISKKVDILCNDLVSAYGELSRQVEGIRTQEGYRKAIEESADLEQLLCHTMDWLLRQIGYSNVAVWLAGDDGQYQLGAYMKYTVPGDPPVLAALQRVVLPLASPSAGEPLDGVVRVKADGLRDKLKPDEYAALAGHDLLALNCTYLGESLAALVFFRDGATGGTPFGAEHEAILKGIGPVFAVALAGIVRDAGGEDDEDDDVDESNDPADGPAGGLADEPGTTEATGSDGPNGTGEAGPGKGGKGGKRRDKTDAADWWKRGEPPPF